MTQIADNLYVTRTLLPGEIALAHLGMPGGPLLYAFYHNRLPTNGGPWAGLETYQPQPGPDPAQGYGALPLRLWGQHFLAEAGGEVACRALYVPFVCLQQPLDRPPRGGGIYPDYNDLRVRLEPRQGQLFFVDNLHPQGVS